MSIYINEEQEQAITHDTGPLLVIAGAGTGKTTVITERIKHLILNKHVSPSNLLALTFTEKAALEMEERIDVALPYGYTQMWIATYHAFCDRILRDEAIHIGLNPAYKLVTEAEQILFLRKNIFLFHLDYFRPLGNPYKFLSGIVQHFSRLKDEDITSNEYLQYASSLSENATIEKDEIKKITELANAYKIYEDLKIKEGIMDFSDLIANVLKLFRERKNILAQYQNKFHYILVDEFQDTNYAQNQLALLLAGKQKNITAVGDDDQAIYRWRGAAISNMIQFKENFPNARIITLTKNYRSTEEILKSSHTLIQFNNPDRLEEKEHIDKKLTSERKIKGSDIAVIFENRADNEADAVVKKISDLVSSKKFQYKDIAILIRANDHSQPFVRALQRYDIPFQFLGPGHLFEQEEIKDLIAYLKVLYNFEDSASLYRILCLPIYKISARDIAALLNYSRRLNLTLFETLEKILTQKDTPEVILEENTIASITKIMSLIKNHLEKIPRESAGQILYYFLQESGILNTLLLTNSETDEKKFINISHFFDKLKSFEATNENASVFAIVEWIDLSMQMGESPVITDNDWSTNNAVNILTIHASKGLEFPVVFLVNLVSQRFPTRERRELIPIPTELIKEILPLGDYHLQEERRLFYVGMTRARDLLFLTAANYYGDGKRQRKISPFVFEALGKDYIETLVKREKEKPIALQQSLLDWTMKKETATYDNVQPTNIFPVTYLSYSQIKTFTICPLHYKLRYLLKIPTEQTASQSYGMSLHATLKEIYQFVKDDTAFSIDTALGLLDKNWIHEGYKSKQHEQAAITHAREIMSNYIKKNIYDTPLKPNSIALELPFQFHISQLPDSNTTLKIGGRIDRIDALEGNAIEIIDYKTGLTMVDEKKLKDDLQLNIYALAATEIKDDIIHRAPNDILLSLLYVENNIKLSTTPTDAQLVLSKMQLVSVAKQIAESEFICSKSRFCEDCEYKMLCSTQ